ncbi:MerR family transcriptional regulator [Mangrovibacillus cuniculi]|uniref:MerR family transcriptional regulator n=1 Tax=Mangrovibacillus cuniculi TaxID=2593652 RepID=A0A7S8CDU4_9BACI|nr:MerR family transcriptional regulator [Mangrovibacillus cuniculi]QPC48121.1 MerR family transcriptional regulator [Mangrovibacillus cuniculi]
MKYSIQQVAKLSSVSTRTLRYYDEIGLLSPSRNDASSYREYTEENLDRLQHIMFYRSLDIPLQQIGQLMNDKHFDPLQTLLNHRKNLLEKREQLERLIQQVDATIDAKKGRRTMSAEEKFEAFKDSVLKENEQIYGKEIREKYGDEQIDQSYQKMKSLSKQEWEKADVLGKEILKTLARTMQTGDPFSIEAQHLASLHKNWISHYWCHYSKEAHAGLAEMYVADERFTNFYDKKAGKGAAVFLRDAIKAYTGK